MAAKKKKARQKDLPGMENREIKELDDAALEYAEIRDERQDLTRKEVASKTALLGLMHKLKKSDYIAPGGAIEVHIIVEKEKVKVKIRKDDADSLDGTDVDLTGEEGSSE